MDSFIRTVCVSIVVFLCFSKKNSAAAAENPERPIIDTACGQVQGFREFTMYDNKPFYSFKGIPYAEPPINDLRFMPPQRRFQPWSGVYNASYFRNNCIQFGDDDAAQGTEDCLYVNVYSTDPSPSANLPVVVVLHGGSFTSGAGQQFAPDFLFNEIDMVMVTFNYRLGVFGFLTLGLADYSGNMALKDQRLALTWINENIQQFGGDIQRITLYGTSAGASSAQFHMLSPGSAGLFHRVILSSGSGLNPWTFSHTNHLTATYKFATQNGVPINNMETLVNFLKTVDSSKFYANNSSFVPKESTLENAEQTYAAVFDSSSFDPFFPESPFDVMNSRSYQSNVDAMIGVSSAESLYFTRRLGTNANTLFQTIMGGNLKIAFPLFLLNDGVDYDSELYRFVSDEIRQFYFGSIPANNSAEYMRQFIYLVSDVFFNYGIENTVKWHTATSYGATYYYKFDVDGRLNYYKNEARVPFPGATHSDDTFYAFLREPEEIRLIYASLSSDSIERKTIKHICQMYAKFISSGKTTTECGELSNHRPVKYGTNYLDISNNGLACLFDPFDNRIDFWSDLMDKWSYYAYK